MARVRFLVGAVLKTVNAVEAEDLFERLVAGTLGNREIAALFSMGEVRALADGFLAGALKAEVASGRLDRFAAVMAQISLNQRLESARQAIAEGDGIVVDDVYFAPRPDRGLHLFSCDSRTMRVSRSPGQ